MTTYYSALHYASKAEKSATQAKSYADSINPSQFVHLTGTEHITGEKDFDYPPRMKSNLSVSTNATKDTLQEDVLIHSSSNTDGKADGMQVIRSQRTDGSRDVSYRAGFVNSAGNTVWPAVRVGVSANDETYVNLQSASKNYCVTPAVTDNGASITNTQYVNNKFKVVSALPSTVATGVFYFIKE